MTELRRRKRNTDGEAYEMLAFDASGPRVLGKSKRTGRKGQMVNYPLKQEIVSDQGLAISSRSERSHVEGLRSQKIIHRRVSYIRLKTRVTRRIQTVTKDVSAEVPNITIQRTNESRRWNKSNIRNPNPNISHNTSMAISKNCRTHSGYSSNISSAINPTAKSASLNIYIYLIAAIDGYFLDAERTSPLISLRFKNVTPDRFSNPYHWSCSVLKASPRSTGCNHLPWKNPNPPLVCGPRFPGVGSPCCLLALLEFPHSEEFEGMTHESQELYVGGTRKVPFIGAIENAYRLGVLHTETLMRNQELRYREGIGHRAGKACEPGSLVMKPI